MDLYSLLEKEDRRHNRGACPVCNSELPLADIESHVNRCLDLALQSDDERLAKSLARSGYHPLAAAPASVTAGPPLAADELASGEIVLPPKQGIFSAEDHAYASLLLQEMDTEGGQEDFDTVDLELEQVTPAHSSKPGGYAVDMDALASRHQQSVSASSTPSKGPDSSRPTDRGRGGIKGKRRLLSDDEGDSSDEVVENGRSDGSDSDESGDKAALQARLCTMSKEQLRRLCMRQHRRIGRMKFRIEALEKDLKSVRVSRAMDDEWQLDARKEWEEEQERARKRDEERRKREEDEEEARAMAAALEAIRRQEEAERAAEEAAADADNDDDEEVPLIPNHKHSPGSESHQHQPPPLVEGTEGEEACPATGVDGNGLFGLPREVMLAVFSRLSAKDLAQLSRTCKSLVEPAQDPLLWRELFVSWIRTAKCKKWSEADEAAILEHFAPVPTSEDDTGPASWYHQFKSRYEGWRYSTITGNGEKWVWDRCQQSVTGFSFCTRTHQRWIFDGSRLRVVSGLFNYPMLEWGGNSTLSIQFRPQKAFQCHEGIGIRDTFWNQQLWRFQKTKEEDQLQLEHEAGPEGFLATRVAMGGPVSLRGPYRVQGGIPMPVAALVLLQATGHL